jgi:2-keto-4-pentenoate hydratase/2-oxohepta-3-ene-1,7-dioic acid hydratase in catechol pathway
LGGKKPMRRDVVAPTGYLRAGDRVVCEIERIGKLENNVVAA